MATPEPAATESLQATPPVQDLLDGVRAAVEKCETIRKLKRKRGVKDDAAKPG